MSSAVIGLKAVRHPHDVFCVMLFHLWWNGEAVCNYIINKISAHRGRVTQIVDLDGGRAQGEYAYPVVLGMSSKIN